MAKITKVSATSIAEFAQFAQQFLPDVSGLAPERQFDANWYRGVGRAKTYRLSPGLFRFPHSKEIKDLLKLERVMLEDFRRQGVFHNEQHNNNAKDAEFKLLFMMQHYGIPTRLLDWSTNPFIALYFALSTAHSEKGKFKEDACVWVLNPTTWNKEALKLVVGDVIGPLTHGSSSADSYGAKVMIGNDLEPSALQSMQERPAAILGISNNARMFAQRGVFTIFGRDVSPMEDQFEKNGFPDECLRQIIIPKDNIAQMLNVLIRLGYTDSVSYPDLQGLAMEIRRVRGFGG